MSNIFDRLQLVRGLAKNETGVFATREDAVSYVVNLQYTERPSLQGEPIVLFYESNDSAKGPNVILAVGSVGDGSVNMANRTFFIDTQLTEEEIKELDDKLEDAIKSLTLIPMESDTIKMYSEKREDGTYVSGDTKIKNYIVDDELLVRNNIIQTFEDGLFVFVDMEYDEKESVLKFKVKGETKEFQLPKDQHVIGGHYDTDTESIVLKLADGQEVGIEVHKLIEEWTVLGNNSDTPVVLFKEHVLSSDEHNHAGVYDWQDILSADVRVVSKTDMPTNILEKTPDNRWLYVKGTADNIVYKDGQTVKDALDNADCKVSTSVGNIIYKRPDGIYATAMLNYDALSNTLKYTYSVGNDGRNETVEYQLNSIKLLDDITYDPTTESIVIRYTDAEQKQQKIIVPVGDLIEEWDVLSEAHNVELNKKRNEGKGADILTADVKIYKGDNNILEDKNHELYVNGISSNIKYDVTGDTTVKDVLDKLTENSIELNQKIEDEISDLQIDVKDLSDALDQEIKDRTDGDDELKGIIGTGFTSTDERDTITYKFNELETDVKDRIFEVRSVDATVTTENIDGTVSEKKYATVKVNISEIHNDETDKSSLQNEEIATWTLSNNGNDKSNIIKVDTDGLHADVDLNYDFVENALYFSKTGLGGVKKIQLQSNAIATDIHYDRATEELVFVYSINDGVEDNDVFHKELRVSLKDLIEEWGVVNTSTVTLTRERVEASYADNLYAEVNIDSSHDDNLIEVVRADNGGILENGGLYVSGNKINDKIDAVNTKIDDEVTRSTDKDSEHDEAINTINGKIDALSADTDDRVYEVRNFDGDNTLVIENVAKTDADKKHSNVKVNISTIKGNDVDSTGKYIDRNNIIAALSDGIHADVDLEYDALTNTLYFSKTGSDGFKAIPLASDTLINDIVYDATTEELILSYTVNGEKKEVKVGIRSILDEWRVSSTTTVTLSKEVNHDLGDETHNLDILTAEVNISNNENNILEVRDGGLFVSNTGITKNENEIIVINSELEKLSNALNAEIDRSTAKDDEHDASISALENGIEDLNKNADTRLTEVKAIDNSVSINNSENGINKYAEVGVKLVDSGQTDNIIRLTDLGLYADVNLVYDENSNTLTFTKSGYEPNVIALDKFSRIDSIYYNKETETLDVVYKKGNDVEEAIKVPLKDLIEEWNVAPSDGSISLTKTRVEGNGPDILTAEVVIDKHHADNILENHEGEGLYVSNSGITANTKAIEDLKDYTDGLKDRVENLEDGLAAEILRSTNKDAEHDAEISNIKDNVKALQDDTLQLRKDLNSEVSRAKDEETRLEGLIQSEASRAKDEETVIKGMLKDEETRAKQAEKDLQLEFQGALEKEVNRAVASETALENALNNEVTRATTVEKDLQRQITDNKTSITNLETDLLNEVDRAKASEYSLEKEIHDETDRAVAVEKELEKDLATEILTARNAEKSLDAKIDNEISNRESEISRLEELIANEANSRAECCTEAKNEIIKERDRAIKKEDELNKLITDEALRATAEDNAIRTDLTKEITDRVEAVSSLSAKIETEISRAINAEDTIKDTLEKEIVRSAEKDAALEAAINAEIQDRKDAIDGVKDAIAAATLSFADTTSVKLDKSDSNVVTAKVKVANSDDNIIIIDGEKEGVYASVKLSYNAGTNKIKLITSKGEQEEIQLNAGSVIDDMVYDSDNRALIMHYTGADGSKHEVKFPVNDLFNDWIVENPSEQSAIELTKELGGPGIADKLSGRVLLTNLEDNAIKIVNNGLYVSSSAMSEAVETAECTEKELKAVEKAIFGRVAEGECGEGFKYTPFGNATYIDESTNIYESTFVLDQSIHDLSAFTENVNNNLTIVSGITECLKTELDITQENVLGMAVPECGKKGDGTPFEYIPNEGTNYIWSGKTFNNVDVILDREIKKANDEINITNKNVEILSGDVYNLQVEVDQIEASIGLASDGTYPPHVGCGIISGATTLIEADAQLEAEVCRLRDSLNSLFVGSDTFSTHMYVVKEGLNNYMYTDVRLSHGNGTLHYDGQTELSDILMSDEDLIISNYTGDTVESVEYGAMYDVYEFSDTNALRIVQVTHDDKGQELQPYAKTQGVFLSNNWNCGLYTEGGEGTFDNRYQSDDAEGSSGYDYNNNVR